MELTTGRSETWKGGAIGIGVCVLTLALGTQMQAITGSAGVLLSLLLATAVASWYAGRWVGIATTGVGVLAAAYLLPPMYSFRISAPADSAALYSLALGGVILSLLCGAAWQLRLEARAWQASEQELGKLRALNSDLEQRLQRQEAALAASDRLLNEFAGAALAAPQAGNGRDDLAELARNFQLVQKRSVRPVDCGALIREAQNRYPCDGRCPIVYDPLPAVWGEERELRRLFEILVFRAVHNESVQGLHLTTSRLPDSWLFTAAFRRAGASPQTAPLSPLEFCACDRIVARQGGRCWNNLTSQGDWELMFVLPRRDPTAVRLRA